MSFVCGGGGDRGGSVCRVEIIVLFCVSVASSSSIFRASRLSLLYSSRIRRTRRNTRRAKERRDDQKPHV